MSQQAPPRRSYDSSLRRERAAQTRDRIVTAATKLAHECPAWDWRGLTIRAVAERAGVNERTVYRHFSNEKALHDALMQRLQQEAGVSLDGLALQDVADVTARVFAHVSSFPLVPRTPQEAILTEWDQRRRDALLSAVEPVTAGWPGSQRTMAAAMLDVLWSVMSYERLLAGWQLDSEHATTAITWVIGLVEAAIREGRAPGDSR